MNMEQGLREDGIEGISNCEFATFLAGSALR